MQALLHVSSAKLLGHGVALLQSCLKKITSYMSGAPLQGSHH